uniref:Zgc:171844 n=1 Tax=Gadus morhua TaxID=8049 RepID=A0A8C5BZ68_GADMO
DCLKPRATMEKDRKRASTTYGSAEHTEAADKTGEKLIDVVSMADSTITAENIEDQLFKIERIRDILVRRESELRYMEEPMDDIQPCNEISRLKKELQTLMSVPGEPKKRKKNK